MMLKLVIELYESGLYGWSVCYESQTLAHDIGQSSVKDCILAAVFDLPEGFKLIEISYRGYHMGTYAAADVLERSDFHATLFCDEYRYLSSF